jgi:uncharacterized membrane protein
MAILKLLVSYVLGLFFVVAGVNHFRDPVFYLRMMPAYLPWQTFLVQVSGMAEVGFGVILVFPKTRELAGWGLITLLIAVFPANLNMALHHGHFPEFPEKVLWIRLPLQFLLIALVYWCARSADRSVSRRRI